MNQDFTNETIIDNLPHGHVYKFRVSLLDNKEYYSSSESNEVDLSLSMINGNFLNETLSFNISSYRMDTDSNC